MNNCSDDGVSGMQRKDHHHRGSQHLLVVCTSCPLPWGICGRGGGRRSAWRLWPISLVVCAVTGWPLDCWRPPLMAFWYKPVLEGGAGEDQPSRVSLWVGQGRWVQLIQPLLHQGGGPGAHPCHTSSPQSCQHLHCFERALSYLFKGTNSAWFECTYWKSFVMTVML